jgi:nitroimidazol reductase NimA-like FMN-containing flavoprotein (pyridoxamine 5'-phosphate oxidase superfamily)
MATKDGMPYVVPMNFGLYEENIYLHSAQAGQKIDILKENPNVCVCFTTDHKMRWQNEDVACSYSMKYRSIRAYGKVEFIHDAEEKISALNIIMRKYTDREFQYNDPSIREVLCWKVNVDKWEGRVYGY